MARPSLRRPATSGAVLLAIAAAALVLGAAAGSAAPYVAAAGDQAFADEVARTGDVDAGLRIETRGRADAAALAGAAAALDDATTGLPLAPPVMTSRGSVIRLDARPDVRVRLVAVSGAALDAVPGGTPDGGVWIPQAVADAAGVEPGDDLTLRFGDVTTAVGVGGIRPPVDAASLPAALADLRPLLGPASGSDRTLPPLLIGTPAVVADAADALGDPLETTWVLPADVDGLSPAAIRTSLPGLDAVAASLVDVRTPLGQAVDRVHVGIDALEVTSGLSATVARAESAVAGLAPPVRLLSLAGVAAALLVVAAAARFAAGQRSVELRLAAVRGARPPLVGLRAAAAALPALAIGAAAGTGTALALVAAVGPGAPLDAATIAAAARDSALAVLVAAAVVGALVTASVLEEVRIRRSRVRAVLGQVPWDAVLLALALVALYQLRTRGGVEVGADGAASVNLLALAFPLLAVGGIALAVVRGLGRALPLLRRTGDGWSPPAFLALRRLASARSGALWLVASGVVAFGVLVHAGVLADSVHAGVRDKAVVQVGGDVVAAVAPDARAPAGVPATVVRTGQGTIQPADAAADVVAVRPEELASALDRAGGAVGGGPAVGDVRALGGGGARLPALVIGAGQDDRPTLQVAGTAVPLDVVARPDAFPGMRADRPLVVVAAAGLGEAAVDLAEAVPDGRLWLWGADVPALVDAAGDAGGVAVRTAAAVAGQPRLVAVTWAFGYLQALGGLIGLLAVAGTVLYVQARHDARAVAAALTRRMGLGRRSLRVAAAAELVGLLGTALVIGAVLGVVLGPAVVPALDPVPQLPPTPVVRPPFGLLAGLTVALAAVGWLGSAAVQRGADRRDPSEVLRRAI